jgi:putative membrane protein
MPHHWNDWGPGWGLWGMALMAIFWIVVIVATVLLIRWLTLQSRAPVDGPPEDSPLDILKRRYARGEIDREDFERRKKDLE